MAVAERLALYFGCWERAGHYLLDADGRDVFKKPDGFPWSDGMLDTGLLANKAAADEPDGRVYWTCGGHPDLWFAFVWWDRSVDARRASNSGLYVRGFDVGHAADAFAFGLAAFPSVVARQRHRLVLQK